MTETPVSSLVQKLDETSQLLTSWLSQHAVNIIIILIGAWLLHRFGAKILARVLEYTVRADLYPTKSDRIKRLKTLDSMASAIVKIAVFALVTILILGELNPSYAAALFASAGLITVAVGFGAKDLINDFMSGFFIIAESQYRVGDAIEIAGVSGVVEAVTVRTTILRDLDGNVHYVPNGDIVVTTNKTLGFSRINEDITFAPDTDIERLTHIIKHVGEELAARSEFEKKIKEPPHVAQVVGYNSTGVIVKITAKTGEGDKPEVKSEFYKLLHKALVKNDIMIAAQPAPAGPAAASTKTK